MPLQSYEMKDSGVEWIGEIPKGWDIVRFKFMHKGSNVGLSIDKEFWSTNENDTVFYTAGQKSIYTNYLDFDEEMLTKENDLLLARNGTPYVYFPKVGAIYTDHIIRVSIDANYDKAYIRYCLQQSIAKEVVDTVSIATWSVPIWNRQCLPHPSLQEQQSIASYLDEKCAAIDEIIAEAKATIDEYKSWKASVVFEAVTKGLNPNAEMKDSGVEWIGRIPKDWVIGRIGKYAKFFNGDRGNNYPKPEDFIETGIPFLTAYNLEKEIVDTSIHCKYISQEKYESLGGAKLKINDIIFCLRGAGVGKCAINLTEQNGTVASSLMAIRAINITSKFLLYILKSNVSLAQTSLFMNGTCAENLSAESLASYTIPVPPLSEQQSIAAYLDEKCAAIDGVIAEKEALIGELESYKKSLIFETVTGKRRVC